MYINIVIQKFLTGDLGPKLQVFWIKQIQLVKMGTENSGR